MKPNPTPSNPPFSLILSGGGMRCSWSSGFLLGLKELGLNPTSIVANSGNVGNAVCFASGQTEYMKRVWGASKQ